MRSLENLAIGLIVALLFAWIAVTAIDKLPPSPEERAGKIAGPTN